MKPLLALLAAGCAVTGAFAGIPLRVDPSQSYINVRVTATIDSFTARLTAFEPDIVYDPVTRRVETATLGFHFADLNTGKAARDRQMHEWQLTAQFPDGRFELGAIEATAAGGSVARGQLTLHGITREIAFPVEIAGDHTRLAIDGEARIDTRDFGLKVIRKFAVLKVQPIVLVRFHLQGRLPEPAASAGSSGESPARR